MAKREPQTIEEFDAELQRLTAAKEEIRQQQLALTAQRDALAAERYVAPRKYKPKTQMTEEERAHYMSLPLGKAREDYAAELARMGPVSDGSAVVNAGTLRVRGRVNK